MDDAVNACPLRCFELLPDPRAANIRRRHGPRNMSRLRRMALNLLKAGGGCTQRHSIGRRKIAGGDHQFLLKLIAG
jgi:hypothetical protein